MTYQNSVFNGSDGNVDDLIFFDDMSIENKNDISAINEYVSAKNYTQLAAYIRNGKFHGLNASLFNAIQSRIYNTETFLKTKPDAINNTIDSSTEPVDKAKTMDKCIWVSETV